MTTDSTSTEISDNTIVTTDRPIEELIKLSDYTGFTDAEIKRLIRYFMDQQKTLDDNNISNKINVAIEASNGSQLSLQKETVVNLMQQSIDAINNNSIKSISKDDLSVI